MLVSRSARGGAASAYQSPMVLAFASSHHQVPGAPVPSLRLALGTRKGVPMGDPCRVAIPHRNPIMAGAQDAVERAGGRVELVPRFRRRDYLHERVHSRIGDAGKITRGVLLRGVRRKDGPKVNARRKRAARRRGHHVEIKRVGAALVLRGINDAISRLDAELAEVLDERQRVRLERAVAVEEFDVERLAVRQIHRRTVALAARREQEVVGLLEQLAVGP